MSNKNLSDDSKFSQYPVLNLSSRFHWEIQWINQCFLDLFLISGKRCFFCPLFFLTYIAAFGVSVAILCEGANSDQTTMKYCDLVCGVGIIAVGKSGLTMKLGVKPLFPTPSSGFNFFIYQLFEGLEMRKISVHVIRMQTNPKTKVDSFWIFTDFTELLEFKVRHLPPAPKFQQWLRLPRNRLFENRNTQTPAWPRILESLAR